MLKAVLFDLYDTLIYIEIEAYLKGRERLAAALGVSTEFLFSLWRKHIHARFTGKILTLEDMIKVAAGELGITLDAEVIKELAREEQENLLSSVNPYPDTGNLLAYLKSKGLKICLVSNASQASAPVLSKVNLERYFDAVVFSFQIGITKPEPAIYHEALKRLDVKPEEALFVGDGASEELEGAERAGIKALKVVQDYQDKTFHRNDYKGTRVLNLSGVMDFIRKQICNET
ncbi:MAG: HAD family phosphatase [Firmicutes bacterium]|nr:HAD family phosphatase [Bacillota bacterium]